MSKNYAAGSPIGNNNQPIFDAPAPVKAVATTVKDTTANTSSILILNVNALSVEVGAVGGPAYIKWLAQSTVDGSVAGTSVVTTGAAASYDHMIANNTVRRFVIPVATVAYGASVQAAGPANGLYTHIATAGTLASVISITQFGTSNSY